MSRLHVAAHQDDLGAATALLDQPSAMVARDAQQWTPLHWAAASGATEVVALLVERGVDLEARARFDMRPIHWAAMRGHDVVVARLLEQGASIGATNLYGMTPLHLAGSGEAASVLLTMGAAPDAADHFGMTPLHWSRSSAVAKALVDANADMVARARDDRRPLDMAAASSEEVFQVAVYPQSKLVRIKRDTTFFGLTILNFGLQSKNRVRVSMRSEAARLIGVVPEVLESLHPGQVATVKLEIERVRGLADGLHPVTLETRYDGDQPMIELALQLDTSRGNTPEDRGLVPIGRATIEPAPSRWQLLVYLVAPALVVLVWLFRRAARRR